MPSLGRRAAAELIGTFWLVFGGTGSAVLAAVFLTPAKVPVGIGFAGVALAFGLTVLTMAFALGHISGGHFNPARSTGPAIFIGGWALAQLWLFWIAPIAGALVAGYGYRAIAGEPAFELAGDVAPEPA